MPLVTDHRRSTPGVASATWSDPISVSHPEPGPGWADAFDRAEGADPSNDPDDIAAWYPVFLGTFLLGLLGLGGLWVWNFAI